MKKYLNFSSLKIDCNLLYITRGKIKGKIQICTNREEFEKYQTILRDSSTCQDKQYL